jgi:hypothetical protein
MRDAEENCFAKSIWVDYIEALYTLLASSPLTACKLALFGYKSKKIRC